MAPIPIVNPVKRTPSDLNLPPDYIIPDYWYELQYNGRKLRYTIDIGGNQPPPASGYPLYICMHGGGTSSDDNGNDDGGRGNDYEWNTMYRQWYRWPMDNYYPEPPVGQPVTPNGAAVYVAIRGVSTGVGKPPGQPWTDEYNLHSRPEGQVLLERLIVHLLTPLPSEFGDHPRGPIYTQLVRKRNPITFVDSNKVFLLGFSAGGNGAFELGTRLSDRFAAVVPAAGHPEWCYLANLANVTTVLQVGEDDVYPYNNGNVGFHRAQVYLSRVNKVLDECQSDSRYRNPPGIYVHTCTVVKNADRNANTRANEQVHYYWSQSPLLYQTKQRVLKKEYFPTWLEKWGQQNNPVLISGIPDEAYTDDIVTAIPRIALLKRNPVPPLVVWDLRGRTQEPDKNDPNRVWEQQRYAYWLYLRKPMTTLDANYQPEYASYDNSSGNNALRIERPNDYIAYLLQHSTMLDLTKPIQVYIAGVTRPQSVTVAMSDDIRGATQAARGDTKLQFPAMIYLVKSGNDWVARSARSMAEVGPVIFT